MPDIFDQIVTEEAPKKDIFDQISFNQPSLGSEVGRHIGRTASRVGEAILGLPGDVVRTLGIGAKGLEKGASAIREKIGLSPLKPVERPAGFPGSQEFRNLSTKIFGEAVTPQSKTESFIDDIVSDVAVLALPIKGKIPFLRSIGTALTGNIASEVAKEFGVDPTGQGIAKLGAFFLSGLAGKGNVKKYWTQQYRLAEDSLPKGASIDTFGLDRKLEKLRDELAKGISTPSKKFVEAPLENIRKKVMAGESPVDELIQFKKDINEHRSKIYKDLSGKQSIKYAQGKINDLANILDEEIAKYGKENPKFYEHYKNANEAYAGFNQSRRVGKWINRQIGSIGKPALLILEGVFPKLLPASAASYAGLKGGELMTRIVRNPTLRMFYANMVKDAVKENSGGFIKNLNGLEKGLKKSDPDLFDELGSKS